MKRFLCLPTLNYLFCFNRDLHRSFIASSSDLCLIFSFFNFSTVFSKTLYSIDLIINKNITNFDLVRNHLYDDLNGLILLLFSYLCLFIWLINIFGDKTILIDWKQFFTPLRLNIKIPLWFLAYLKGEALLIRALLASIGA